MSTEAERITVSRETLRAELSQLELRLVDRLSAALETKADGAVVDSLDKRVQALELSRAAREHLSADLPDLDKRVERLERFRYAVPSVSVLSFLATAVLTVHYVLN